MSEILVVGYYEEKPCEKDLLPSMREPASVICYCG